MNNREKFCAWLFEISKAPYRYIFKQKNEAWNLSSSDLCEFPKNSLGYALGQFLKSNEFELIDKLESHDVYHVICQMETSVRDEIGMQYLLMGNGKKSTYQKITVLLGICLLPEYLGYFKFCYQRGKRMLPVYELDLRQALNGNLDQLRTELKIPKSKQHLKIFTLVKD